MQNREIIIIKSIFSRQRAPKRKLRTLAYKQIEREDSTRVFNFLNIKISIIILIYIFFSIFN